MPTTGDDDRRVLEALRAGDEAAFAALVDRLGATMDRIARAYGAGADVVRDTWLAVLAGLDDYAGPSLKAWIFRLLVERASARRPLPTPSLAARAAPGAWFDEPGDWVRHPRPWPRTDERVARAALRPALDALPAPERLVVWLRDAEGLSGEAVCGVLGIGASEQRALLHRGRTSLRAALDRYLAAGAALSA